jgi:hypothetical protein
VGSPRAADLRPLVAARLAVGLATRMLPTPADRRRYYAEFVADLYGQPSTAQLRHAAGVLSQAFALRSALGAPTSPLEEDAVQPFGRRFRCRVLRWHDWHLHSTEDGGRYRSCSVCGKDHPGPLGMDNTIGA